MINYLPLLFFLSVEDLLLEAEVFAFEAEFFDFDCSFLELSALPPLATFAPASNAPLNAPVAAPMTAPLATSVNASVALAIMPSERLFSVFFLQKCFWMLTI